MKLYYLTLAQDIERRLKGAWNFKWFKVCFSWFYLLPAYTNLELSSDWYPPLENPWFDWSTDLWFWLVLVMMSSRAWRWWLVDRYGHLILIPRSPETTRKEILTVGSPFHTNSLLLLTHTYKHSLRSRLPVFDLTSDSTSGRIGRKIEPLPVGVQSRNENYTACYSAFIVFRLPFF